MGKDCYSAITVKLSFSLFFDKLANYQMKTLKLFTRVFHLKCKFVAITLFKSSKEEFAG